MPLREMCDSVGPTDQIVEVEDRGRADTSGRVDASDLQIGMVDEDGSEMSVFPGVGTMPWLDQEDAARF